MEPSVVEWGELVLRMLQLHGGYLVHHGPRDVATLLDVRTVARQPTQHGELRQQLGQLVLNVAYDGLYIERLRRCLQVLRQERDGLRVMIPRPLRVILRHTEEPMHVGAQLCEVVV